MTTADELAPGDWIRVADEVHHVEHVTPQDDHIIVVDTSGTWLVFAPDEAVEVLG